MIDKNHVPATGDRYLLPAEEARGQLVDAQPAQYAKVLDAEGVGDDGNENVCFTVILQVEGPLEPGDDGLREVPLEWLQEHADLQT